MRGTIAVLLFWGLIAVVIKWPAIGLGILVSLGVLFVSVMLWMFAENP